MFASPSSRSSEGLDQLRAVLAELGGTGGTASGVIAQAVGLRARLAQVPDPRRRKGVRHTLASILLIAICALAADKNGFTHIEAWARDAPDQVLSALDVRFEALTGRFTPPNEKTIRVLLGRIDPVALSAAATAHLADIADGSSTAAAVDEREARRARASATTTTTPAASAADGKRMAGARRPDGTRVNLLSVVDHATGATTAQHEIAAKTNEIPELAALLAHADLTGRVLTLDALHTQRETARLIAETHHGYYLMTIKGNQPKLRAAVAARFGRPDQDYADAGRFHADTDRGHGRIEYRQIRTAPADAIDFPHATQIWHITRRSKRLDTEHGWNHKEHVYGITNLPEHLAGPADLARYARGHWGIENRSHYVRDVTFGEDAHQARTGHAPANLATLRNLVIGTFRAAGHTNIAHARSLQANRYERALTLFDL